MSEEDDISEVTLSDFLRHRHATSNVGLLIKHLDADVFQTLIENFGGTTVVFPTKAEISRDFKDYQIVQALKSGNLTQEQLAARHNINQSSVSRTFTDVEEEMLIILKRKRYLRRKYADLNL